MMYPRLFLAKNLLREDGVIFISIDDNEVAHLRKICDEIFGEKNFFANIVWQKKYAATNDAKGFSNMHDHIIVYRKNTNFSRNLLPNLSSG
jgi:adenine-specific DNA-methyltransferase